MIIRSRRKSRTFLSRILGIFRAKTRQKNHQVLNDGEFAFEIRKECSRIARRKDGQFSVITLETMDLEEFADLDKLVEGFSRRLRITDAIGVLNNFPAILLPETGREGATEVANDLVEIAQNYDLEIVVQVYVYPDDDPLAHGANEFEEWIETNTFETDRMESREESSDSLLDRATEIASPETRSFNQLVQIDVPWWKRATDIFCAGVGLLVLSPLLLLAAAMIKLTSKGPVLFCQLREGKDGRPFHIYKFRTMTQDAEQLQEQLRGDSEQDGPAFKLENDPRLTLVGRYLRKSCIDELPQLVNVLKGEMSLVGPRPLPVHESVDCKVWQRERLRILPGLTCIWQVFGDRHTKFSEWMRMDLEYLRKQSFWFDLKLIFQTALVVLLHKGSV